MYLGMFAHAPGAGSTNASSAGAAANDEEYEPPKEEVKVVSIFGTMSRTDDWTTELLLFHFLQTTCLK